MLAVADRAIPGGTRTKVEKILNGDGELIEFHIKKTVSGMRCKILVSPDGTLRRVFREIPAEIEVPVKVAR